MGTWPTVLTLTAACVVVAVACAVHGAVGFGMNLLAVPVLAVLDPALVPGPAVAAGLVLSVLIVAREPAAVDRRLGWAVVGLVPGNAVALALLAAVPVSALAVPTGVLVLVAVAASAVLVPGVVVGFLASGPIRGFVDRGHTRPAVLCLSAVAGVVAIVQGLLA